MSKAKGILSTFLIAFFIILAFLVFTLKNPPKEENIMSANDQNTATSQASPSAQTKKKYDKAPPVLSEAELTGKTATITTGKGQIKIELFGQDAPKAVSNFIFLTRDGFYDGLTFHRREEGFVIQGGDPNGDGTGGPGYQFEDEPVTKNYDRGIVAMANAGKDTNGSQFFIMLADNQSLPKNYIIFGKVSEGMEVVDKIQISDVMQKIEIN
jgi:cyclophilin family peptidyl-prolyl cis-trans isomerase